MTQRIELADLLGHVAYLVAMSTISLPVATRRLNRLLRESPERKETRT